MSEKNAKNLLESVREPRMMVKVIVVALTLFACVSTASAQQAGRRPTPSLTSEDLLDRASSYTRAPEASRPSSPSASRLTPAGAMYRDPAGAFSLSLPSGNWCLNARSQEKGKLSDLRVFRKLDADGFASATASVYVVPASAPLSAEALVARFLSNSAEIVSSGANASGFQVIADQLVSRRAVVRASISAFQRDGKLFVVVCRAPLESFDAEAREFASITQSLAVSVARSS